MDMNEYQELAMKTCNGQEYKLDIQIMAILGLVGESGECAELIKKARFHDHEFVVETFKKELGDVLWYVSCLAWTVGLDLEEVAQGNIAKLRKRYPEGFDPERSKNREE